MALDCSPAEQDKRRQMLEELRGKKFSGVASISDRSRSVNYHDPVQLTKLIRALETEMALCDGTYRRGRRIWSPAYVKWL
jgi:hypothetical protein